mgnify:CR=1 FL=1
MNKFEDLSVILKLVSGETILCQVLSDTDKNMIIRDPLEIRVHSQTTSEGVRSTTYYADWFLASKSRIHMIRKEHVISAAIPDEATKTNYAGIIENRDGTPSEPDKKLNWEQQFDFGDTSPDR